MFGGGGGPQPKGDVRTLWEALEVTVPGRASMQGPGLFDGELVWQDHNPYPNLEAATPLWLFIDEAAAGVQEGEALSDESRDHVGASPGTGDPRGRCLSEGRRHADAHAAPDHIANVGDAGHANGAGNSERPVNLCD